MYVCLDRLSSGSWMVWFLILNQTIKDDCSCSVSKVQPPGFLVISITLTQVDKEKQLCVQGEIFTKFQNSKAEFVIL